MSATSRYRMPAEWEPHAATWLAWPHNRTDWPGKFEPIPWVYCEIVYHLARVERVRILVNDARSEEKARAALTKANALRESVEFHRWPTNRGWTRDYGPIFVRCEGRRARSSVAVMNFQFNAWAKYHDCELDEKIAARAARELGRDAVLPEVDAGGRRRRVVLEGGAIDVNGQGSMLTTAECLLSVAQARNPGLGREQLERVFEQYLGVRHVIWLGAGIAGDDTHGHVDDIARFCAPGTVAAAVETDRQDANHAPLAANLATLRAATDQDGRRLEVVELPMPRAIVFRGQRLPASYANFYIANGLVLAPTFNDPNDRIALDTLAALFPGRTVVGIHCGDLVWGLGTIHCMTQQEPK